MESINKLNNELFWRKYRPNNLKSIILLPRIRKYIADETGTNLTLTSNILMVGRPGVGKTSLAKIIENEYDTLKINASKDMNMEALRTEVTEFCLTMDVMAKRPEAKVVFLDEFDGVKPMVQEALRSFIEEFDQHVRFVATANDISSISTAMLSRFTLLNFEPEDTNEVVYLKDKYSKRLIRMAEVESINISADDINTIVDKKFPDFRDMTMTLQYVKKVGVSQGSNLFIHEDLYDLIINNTNTISTYEMVVNKYSQNINELIYALGRPFSDWILSKHPKLANNLAKSLPTVAKYANMKYNIVDPVVLGCALIYELQNIYK